MSSRRSEARKILRNTNRMAKKQEAARVRAERASKIEGETKEEELARKTRDLGRWLDMMTEREVEEAVLKAAEIAEKEESDDGSQDENGTGGGDVADEPSGSQPQPDESEGNSVPGPVAEG